MEHKAVRFKGEEGGRKRVKGMVHICGTVNKVM
jgi:hypothetical protein